MQNMEKFYGFKVAICSQLEPFYVKSLKKRAEKLIEAQNFNDEEYFVYYHKLTIEYKKNLFEEERRLSERVDHIQLSFEVNKKQCNNHRIKLYNYILDEDPNKLFKTYFSEQKIEFNIDGDYLEKHRGFDNEIVTFISKKVCKNHRKIKVSVTAFPTNDHKKKLIDPKKGQLTQLDFKFKNSIITLRPPKRIDKSNLVDIKTHTFDVALSFPGEVREYASSVAGELEKILGKDTCFYDFNYQAQLAVPNADLLLQDIYSSRSKLIIVFVCNKYQEKKWCGLEFRAIRNIIYEKKDKVMFVKMDDGKVDGIFEIDGFIDGVIYNPQKVAEYIKEQLSFL